MSLGLLAKDSIQDLTALVNDEIADEEIESPSDRLSLDHGSAHEPLKATASPRIVATKTALGQAHTPESSTHSQEAEATVAASSGNADLPQIANPQQAQEEGEEAPKSQRRARFPPANTYGRYTGFNTDYYDQTQTHPSDSMESTYNYHDSYAPLVLSERKSSFFPNLVCCLFPWMATQNKPILRQQSSEFEAETYEQETIDHSSAPAEDSPASSPKVTTKVGSSSKQDEDEVSSGSDMLGEKLSDKERQAVLARLGLAQPDPEASERSSVSEEKGLLNGIPTYDTSPLKSIENSKEPSSRKLKSILKRGSMVDMKAAQQQAQGDKSGTPRRRSLFPSYESGNGKSLSVSFSPMARVVTVRSKNSMSSTDKADVWWQKQDYEEFRKTGRIVTKAMLTGGSEIWLTNSTSSSKGQIEPLSSTGDKWWHRFGHSRRGLEHVVSMEEGRDRQINVRLAIKAVVEEQSRQRMYKREDPEKLRHVALNHTTWARDLALASGASDADAVKANFGEERKSREFYLLKMAKSMTSKARNVPKFMSPTAHTQQQKSSISSPRGTMQQRLDANTAAQLSFRRRQLATITPTVSRRQEKETSEPIRDACPEDPSGESLAHRAAGFLVDGAEKVDMAAVLSGMGAVAT